MNISDFLAKAFGVTERLEAITAKLEADHSAAITAKETEIADLRSQLEAAPKPEAITDLQSKVSALETEKKDLEAKVANLPAAVNDKAAEIVAANGHAPVNTATSAVADDSKTKIQALEAKIKAETDPFKRTALFKEHKAEIAKARALFS